MRIVSIIAAFVSAIVIAGLAAVPAHANQFDKFDDPGWWNNVDPASVNNTNQDTYRKYTYTDFQAGCQGQGADGTHAAYKFLYLTPKRRNASGTTFFSNGIEDRVRDHIDRALSIFAASAQLVMNSSNGAWKQGPIPRLVVNPLSNGECTVNFKLVNDVPNHLTDDSGDVQGLLSWLEGTDPDTGNLRCDVCHDPNQRFIALIDGSSVDATLGATTLVSHTSRPDSDNPNNLPSYNRLAIVFGKYYDESSVTFKVDHDHGATIAHEIAHNLGALLNEAPNNCGAHSKVFPDIMNAGCVNVVWAPNQHERYDYRFDQMETDYFGWRNPGTWLSSHWNTVNSQFVWAGIEPPQTYNPRSGATEQETLVVNKRH